MYWPRLRLTAEEMTRWTPYYEPNKLQRGVLYRAYNGEINLDSQTKEDTENIQISRRARILALTASGDVHNMEITISDSGGEQYTMGFTPMVNLLMGMNVDPRGMATFNTTINPTLDPRRLALLNVFSGAFYIAPHIFEPNIVLDANQTLIVKGRNLVQLQLTEPEDTNPSSHVSFNLHVWEFPVE